MSDLNPVFWKYLLILYIGYIIKSYVGSCTALDIVLATTPSSAITFWKAHLSKSFLFLANTC